MEVRNNWRPTFSTYYRYGLIYYDEGKHTHYIDDEEPDEPELGTPETGHRHTGEIGFEWFFAKKSSLIGAYTFQQDESSGGARSCECLNEHGASPPSPDYIDIADA